MIQVRLFEDGDISNWLIDWANERGSERTTPSDNIVTRRYLDMEKSLVGNVVVAEDEGKVVGFGGVKLDAGRHVAWFHMNQEAKKKYAIFLYRALSVAIPAIIADLDNKPLYAFVRPSHKPSIRLATSLGFKPMHEESEGLLMIREA